MEETTTAITAVKQEARLRDCAAQIEAQHCFCSAADDAAASKGCSGNVTDFCFCTKDLITEGSKIEQPEAIQEYHSMNVRISSKETQLWFTLLKRELILIIMICPNSLHIIETQFK